MRTIVLEVGASIDLYSVRTSGELSLRIIHNGEGSISRIQCGLRAHEKTEIEMKIRTVFEANHASSEINILSLAESWGKVFLDTVMDIQEWVSGITAHLKERHVFLGSSGKIRGIPALVVHSDDVEATHALAIDRISDEELFYLRSRWLYRDDAMQLMLEGAISQIFWKLAEETGDIYETCKKIVLGM